MKNLKQTLCAVTLFLLLLTAMLPSWAAEADAEPASPGLKEERDAEALERRDVLIAAQMEYAAALGAVAKAAAEGGEDAPYLWSRAEFLIEKIYSLVSETGNAEDAMAAFAALETNDPAKTPPVLLARARWLRASFLLKAGKPDAVRDAVKPLGLIRSWYICGPFDNERGRSFDIPFTPETEPIQLGAEYKGKKRPVRWRFHTTRDPMGVLRLSSLLLPNEECLAYAFCVIRSDRAQPAALRFGSDDGAAVWVNGREVFRNALERTLDLDQSACAIQLQKGTNLILFKVGQVRGEWALCARLTDLAGRPLERVAEVTALPAVRAALKAVKPVAEDAAGGADVEIDRGAVSLLAERIQADASRYRDAYYLGSLLMLRQNLGEHQTYDRQLLGMAAKLAKTDSIYYLALAQASEERARTAPDRDENVRRRALETACSLSNEEVAALVRLARYYFESMGNAFRAEALLDEALAINPMSTRARLMRVNLYRQRGWTPQALAVVGEVVRRNPSSFDALRTQGSLLRQIDRRAEALEAYRKAVALDATSYSVARTLYLLLQQSGHSDEALAVLERYQALVPYDGRAALECVTALHRMGRFAEAQAAANRRLGDCPDDHDVLALRGHCFSEMGDEASAKADWTRALELQPSFLSLKRYMQFCEKNGREEENGVEDLAAYAATFENYAPPAGQSRVFLLNETRDLVNADGTRSKIRHKIVRVLDRDGAADLQRTRIFYNPDFETVHVQAARVLHGDGTEAEAQTHKALRGRYGLFYLLFSALEKGDVIEVLYRVDRFRPDFFGDYFAQEIHFQKSSPVLVSRYVLQTPTDKTFYLHTRGDVPEPVSVTAAKRLTRTWEMRSLPAIEEDRHMPPEREVSPTLQISTFATWDDLARWYHHLIRAQNQITPEIRKKAEALTRDKTTDAEKLNALLRYAAHEINNEAWSFGVHGYKPYSAETIFTRRFGDCKDKTTLINVMARSLGYEAWPVLVRATDPNDAVAGRGDEDFTLPMLIHFNHLISQVWTPEGAYFLDGTIAYRTLDGVHYTIADGRAVIVKEDGAEVSRIPAQTAVSNLWEDRLRVDVTAGGAGNLVQDLTARGNAALYLRAYFSNPTVANLVMRRVGSRNYGTVTGAEAQFQPHAGNDTVQLSSTVGVRDLAKADGKRMRFLLPKAWLRGALGKSGALPLELSKEYAPYSLREYDLVLPMLFRVKRTIVVNWPPDWALLGAPEPVDLKLPFGSCVLSTSRVGSTMTFDILIEFSRLRIRKEEYPLFRTLCILADRILQTPIVLEKK